jgi:putative transcriptional regulator
MGERKLRVADVARGTGLSRSTVTSLYKETAERIDLDTIDALCEFLDCEVGELFVREK